MNDQDDNCIDRDISENHSELINNIAKLDKNLLRVAKPTRSEPTSEISEFHLIKSGVADRDVIKIKELTKTLCEKSKNYQLNKKVNTSKFSQVVRKPLEKLTADKLRRQIGFKNIQSDFNKWNDLVNKSRVVDSLLFPLKQTSIKYDPVDEFTKRYKIKSNLETELQLLEPKQRVEPKNSVDEFPLTLEEILQKTRNAAKLRAQQMYKSVKAHRQKMIKSKTFHKYKKREKIKQKLKEFEELQQTDPEAALQKFMQLDKIRAEERMSLKHKNTGLWAKNKQIRARYDKQSRQLLAQQVSIGRDLTKKIHIGNDNEDKECNRELTETSLSLLTNNLPKNEKDESDIEEFVCKFRKYWHNNRERSKIMDDVDPINPKEDINTTCNNQLSNPSLNDGEKIISSTKDCLNNSSNQTNSEVSTHSEESISILKVTSCKKKSMITNVGTTNWFIDSVNMKNSNNSGILNTALSQTMIDTIFNDVRDNINVESCKRKAKRKKTNKRKYPLKRINITNDEAENENSLLKESHCYPQIDETLIEVITQNENNSIPKNKKLPLVTSSNLFSLSLKVNPPEIDPKHYINIKSKFINTQLPKEEINCADKSVNDHDKKIQTNSQYDIITEAFIDDDVVDEFTKEQQMEVDKSQIKSLDTILPGWGRWGGRNVNISESKKQRVIRKYPEILKPINENKNFILIETDENKLKDHQVNDIPYPFNSSIDFEASIRAPYGRNFIPEKSHKFITQPTIITKKGTVINPISRDMLMQKRL